jgi:hypothetical protein
MGKVIDLLPSKCEALSSNPSTPNTKIEKETNVKRLHTI